MSIYAWTYILVLLGLILSLCAQIKVKSTYKKNARIQSQARVRAWQAVGQLLLQNGNPNVEVREVTGTLTDHYDPGSDVLYLSEDVFGSASLAALGIAAHEAGHAMQKFEGYGPMKVRSALVPVVQFSSRAYLPLFGLGLLLSWEPLITAGVVIFALIFIFSLITLPVEFNASRRGVDMLLQGGLITSQEEPAVKSVLGAAALTYVASAVTSLTQMARLLALSKRRR